MGFAPILVFAQNDKYVALEEAIDCGLAGLQYQSVVGSPQATSGTVSALRCQISGKPEKDITLRSDKIASGFLETQDFGKIRIEVSNNITSAGFSMYMRKSDQTKLKKCLANLQEVCATYISARPKRCSFKSRSF